MIGRSDRHGGDTHQVLFIKMWIFKNVAVIKIQPDERKLWIQWVHFTGSSRRHTKDEPTMTYMWLMWTSHVSVVQYTGCLYRTHWTWDHCSTVHYVSDRKAGLMSSKLLFFIFIYKSGFPSFREWCLMFRRKSISCPCVCYRTAVRTWWA